MATAARAIPTITACVRQFCLECLGANTARGAHDCESQVCPLYACAPFRSGGHRRAMKADISAYCRHCQPEDESDCGGPYVYPDGTLAQPECALFPWRPWQPGGVPRTRTVSAEERSRLARMSEAARTQRERP